MRVQRRTNPLWGLIVLAAALFITASMLNLIPAGITDLVLRAAPALLVLAGLWLILRDRLPVGGLIALVLTAAVTGGVAVTAYNSLASQIRDENQQPISAQVSENITLLRVNIDTLDTDVELLRALDRSSGITGQFSGSTASSVLVDYTEANDDTATLVVSESQSSGFPTLDAIGRGTLRVELPPGVPIDVQFSGAAGDVVLNMSGLSLERLNVSTARGDVIVTLPTYDPLFSQPADLLGELATSNGNMTMIIPSEVRARLELNTGGSGIAPDYPPTYNLVGGVILEANDIVGAELVVRYALTVPRGQIRIESPS